MLESGLAGHTLHLSEDTLPIAIEEQNINCCGNCSTNHSWVYMRQCSVRALFERNSACQISFPFPHRIFISVPKVAAVRSLTVTQSILYGIKHGRTFWHTVQYPYIVKYVQAKWKWEDISIKWSEIVRCQTIKICSADDVILGTPFKSGAIKIVQFTYCIVSNKRPPRISTHFVLDTQCKCCECSLINTHLD